MRTVRLSGAVLIAVVTAACGSSSSTPTTPTPSAPTDVTTAPPAPAPAPAPVPTPAPPAVPPGPCSIGFEGFTINGAPAGTHSACGVHVIPNGAWHAVTTYGVPPPFIQFMAPGGSTTTGDVTLQSPDGLFTFTSVDVYSSTTKIPYEITGSAGGTLVFAFHDVVGNTFGLFATVVNPHRGAAVDTVRIRLSNPAAPCCNNPVGLDNIRVAR
jgi:hypothetical protein